MLMREGFTRTSPHPVHLEATTARSRNIYAHFKFEVRLCGISYSGFLIVFHQVDEEHQFGKGQVDANGLAARGQDATGVAEWVMTKVRISFVVL
jgi:hypothetical protein